MRQRSKLGLQSQQKRGTRTSTGAKWTAARRCSGRSTTDNVAEVQRLLKAGANVSLANNYGATPMSLAAEVGNAEIIKLLLEAGANADSPNPDGQTALLAVARTGNVEAAELLVEHGANSRCAGKMGRTDRADVGVGAPASEDDAAPDLQRRRRQCPLASIATTSVMCTAEGRPKNLDTGGLHAAAVCRARELHRVRGGVAREQGGHQPAGSRWRLAAAAGDHECELGSGEATDRRRRRRQSVGHLWRSAAVHGDRPAQSGSTADAASIDPPNKTNGTGDRPPAARARRQSEHAALLPPGEPARRDQYAGLHAADPRGRPTRISKSSSCCWNTAPTPRSTMADRQTPIMAVLAGRASETQALELIRVLQEAGADVNVVALVNHREESRGGTALHYAVRKRYKEVIKLLASFGIDMNAKDQDGLTALDYTQSRGFMPFMALQTPVYKEEAALLRELGATEAVRRSPVWPVLGPPQGVEAGHLAAG